MKTAAFILLSLVSLFICMAIVAFTAQKIAGWRNQNQGF